MKAVTAGALLFAGVSCTSDDPTDNDDSWNLEEPGGDATADDADDGDVDTGDATVSDTGTDVIAVDTGSDGGMVDADIRCDDEERTGVCPDECTMDSDIDCCEENDGCWDSGTCWEGGCAVPGPFVPPKMSA